MIGPVIKEEIKMDDRTEPLLEIAKVVGTHGLKGDLRVRPSSGDPELLLSSDQFHLRLVTGKTLILQPLRQTQHKGQALLRFQGYESINLAEPLLGAQLLIDRSQLPELEDDEYYWHQLKGLSVIDCQHGLLGHLEQMFTTSAHDTYVVNGVRGEIMIPVVEQFVLGIDLQQRVINVDLPDGLLPDAE